MANTQPNVSADKSEDSAPDQPGTMRPVTDLSAARVWTPDASPSCPRTRAGAGCPRRPGPADRADRRRRTAGAPPAGVAPRLRSVGPAVGDWVAVRGELAVALLPADERLRAHRRRPRRRRRRSSRPTSTSCWWSTRCRPTRGCAGSSGTSPSPGAAGPRRSSSSPRPTCATTSRRRWRRSPRTPSASTSWRSARSPARGWTASGRCWARAAPARWSARRASGKSSLANALAGRGARGDRRDPGRRPRPAHDHRPRAAPAARRRPARRHPGHAGAGALRRRRRASRPPTPTSPRWPPDCRFRDCAHRTEPGCAVAAAIDDGRLDPARFTAWRKLQAEAHRQVLRVDARARAAEQARVRAFHRASASSRTGCR